MAKAKRRYSPSIIDRAISMYESEKTTMKDAASAAGMTKSALNYHCIRQGIVGKNQYFRETPTTEKIYYRNGKPVRRFTQAEDELIQRLSSEEKKSAYAIGKIVNRKKHSITLRLASLARRQAAKEGEK